MAEEGHLALEDRILLRGVLGKAVEQCDVGIDRRAQGRPEPGTPGLGSFRTRVVFHRAALQMLDGDAVLLRAKPGRRPKAVLAELAPVSTAGSSKVIEVATGALEINDCLLVRPADGQRASVTYALGKRFGLLRGTAMLDGAAAGTKVTFKIIGDGFKSQIS